MRRHVRRPSIARGFAAALVIALSAVGCGEPSGGPGAPGEVADPAATREVSLAAPPTGAVTGDLELAEVGTVGDLPPPATCVVLRIDREGGLSVDGRPVAEDALVRRVVERRARDDAADVLLAVDRTVPWAATARLLAVAGDALRTRRVHFLVAPEGGGAPGAMATFLPGSHEACCAPTADCDPVRVGVAPSDEASADPRALREALSALPRASRDVRVEVAVHPLVPTGEALRAVDVVFRSGFAGVGFASVSAHPDARGSIRELVARARASPRAVRWTLCGAALAAPAEGTASLAAVARVAGRPAGDWAPQEPTVAAAPPGADASVGDAPLADGAGPPAAADPATPPRPPERTRPRPPRRRSLDGVELALDWLAAHASPDGRFSARDFGGWCRGEPWAGPAAPGAGLASRDRETTALALIALLGAGYSPRSEGALGTAVARGVAWLVAQMDADGALGDRSDPAALRDHALGTLALAMADRATGGGRGVRAALGRALAFAAAARHPGGGWGRGDRSGDLDVVTTAWMALAWAQARRAGADARGPLVPPLVIDDRAIVEARDAVVAATDAGAGRAVSVPADRRDEATTAAVLVVRRLAGEDLKAPPLAAAVAALTAEAPTRDAGRVPDPLAVWFGTLVAYEHAGPPWKAWDAELKAAVLDAQRTDGEPCDVRGSWDPSGTGAAEGGRVAATALWTLVAEVHFRYDRVPTLDVR